MLRKDINGQQSATLAVAKAVNHMFIGNYACEFCITRTCTCIIPSTESRKDEKKTNKEKAETMAGGVYRIEFGKVGRSGERVNVCKTSARKWAEDEYARMGRGRGARMGRGRVRANGLGTSARE